MAKITEPTDEQRQGWNDWVASRPECVRRIAEKFDPWTLYRMNDTEHRVTLHSFGEDEDGTVTLTVDVTGQFNLVNFERQVFGVNPDNLTECDLPDKGEPLGVSMSDDERNAYIDQRRTANGLPPLRKN